MIVQPRAELAFREHAFGKPVVKTELVFEFALGGELLNDHHFGAPDPVGKRFSQ